MPFITGQPSNSGSGNNNNNSNASNTPTTSVSSRVRVSLQDRIDFYSNQASASEFQREQARLSTSTRQADAEMRAALPGIVLARMTRAQQGNPIPRQGRASAPPRRSLRNHPNGNGIQLNGDQANGHSTPVGNGGPVDGSPATDSSGRPLTRARVRRLGSSAAASHRGPADNTGRDDRRPDRSRSPRGDANQSRYPTRDRGDQSRYPVRDRHDAAR